MDQLSLTFPNPAFTQQATALLEQAGYVVDYYPGEEVTVDFFRTLPDRGYEYLILRVHSTAVLREAGGATSSENAVLFTGEPHNPAKHVEEQVGRYLALTHYPWDEESYYFGIAPSFVRSRMEGSFEGATVILLGCEALMADTAASAFVDRGAGAVIGWDGPVSASHTDAAAERLLRHLLVDLESADEAVAEVMAEVGPDPTHGSRLLVYPSGG